MTAKITALGRIWDASGFTDPLGEKKCVHCGEGCVSGRREVILPGLIPWAGNSTSSLLFWPSFQEVLAPLTPKVGLSLVLESFLPWIVLGWVTTCL